MGKLELGLYDVFSQATMAESPELVKKSTTLFGAVP
jgi:hypothetical protein